MKELRRTDCVSFNQAAVKEQQKKIKALFGKTSTSPSFMPPTAPRQRDSFTMQGIDTPVYDLGPGILRRVQTAK